MDNRTEQIFSSLLVLTLLLGTLLTFIPLTSASPGAVLKVIPAFKEFGVGHTNEVGTAFTVAVVVENMTNLYALEVMFGWDTTYLEYVTHTVTMPQDDYPDPIPPSSYNGTLYEGPEGGIMVIKDVVDESGVSGAPSGTLYWLSVSQMGVCPEFFGNGTLFVMAFRLKKQPYDYEVTDFVDTLLHFVSTDLADSKVPPTHLIHTKEDGTVRIWSIPFMYPPRPQLKVMPELTENLAFGAEFDVDIWLMDEYEGDLDDFWDVAGVDMLLHFNTTLLSAIDAELDPNGWFATFWPGGTMEIMEEINNTAGTVWFAFAGLPDVGGGHTPPEGKGIVARVTFTVLYESTITPVPCEPIYLENPPTYVIQRKIVAEAGLIDIKSPVSTYWMEPATDYQYHLLSWEDNGDGELSASDQAVLNNTDTGFYFDYRVDELRGAMEATVIPWIQNETLGKSINSPKLMFGTPGDFLLTYVDLGIYAIHVKFANGTERDLDPAEYTEYLGETRVRINEYLDSLIVESMTLGVDCWLPWVEYPSGNCASSIVGIHAYFPDGHERDLIYGTDYYYDSSWSGEIEMDIADPTEFVDGTILEVTYWGLASATILYDATDPVTHRYWQYDGTYEEFLVAIDTDDATCTNWTEIYPSYLPYHIENMTDNDGSGNLSAGDTIWLKEITSGNIRKYNVDKVETEIIVSQKDCICKVDPSHEYYCEKPIVDIAGFPHPERPMCPWHSEDYSPPLPHTVESADFCAKYKALGRAIDVFTQYPYPYGGQGPHKDSDAFGPQNEVILCANVTYNLGPVQKKLVTFEIQHGEWAWIRQDVSDEDGVACVSIRVPWPCDDPEGRVFGQWNVTATVEIADIVVNDTLNFEVNYLVEIISVTPEYSIYLKGAHMKFTVEYVSHSQQDRHVAFTVVVYDELGVAIGSMYFGTTVEYNDGLPQTIVFECMIIPKHAYIGEATVYANALTKRAIFGGTAYCPEVPENFTIG